MGTMMYVCLHRWERRLLFALLGRAEKRLKKRGKEENSGEAVIFFECNQCMKCKNEYADNSECLERTMAMLNKMGQSCISQCSFYRIFDDIDERLPEEFE